MIEATDEEDSYFTNELKELFSKNGTDSDVLSILDYHSDFKLLIGKDFKELFSLTPGTLSLKSTEEQLARRRCRNAATKFLNLFRRISILDRWYTVSRKELKCKQFDADFRVACDICAMFLKSACRMKVDKRILYLAFLKSFRNGRENLKYATRTESDSNSKNESNSSNCINSEQDADSDNAVNVNVDIKSSKKASNSDDESSKNVNNNNDS